MNTVTENTNLMKQPEEWKPIYGYDGMYEVSNYGRVKSYKYNSDGRILKSGNNRLGYYYVVLCKEGKEKTCSIHRLVAEAFIPNPNNFSCINHKDENKGNNCVQNLEWCTHSYNNSYGTKLQRVAEKISKPVVQLDKEGNLVAEYKSILEASRLTGVASISICYCCKHKQGHYSAGGFIFLYKDEYAATQTQQDQ